MRLCRSIGESYHRTDKQKRVDAVCNILMALGHVLLDPEFEGAAPVQQVDQAGYQNIASIVSLLLRGRHRLV